MIRLSENVLDAITLLLKRIQKFNYDSVDDLCSTSISSIQGTELWRLVLTCQWSLTEDMRPKLTTRGDLIAAADKQGQYQECLRLMLMDYVLCVKPIWSSRIPFGRKEATLFMTQDERSCFSEAGLLQSEPDIEIVIWWDTLAEKIREYSDKHKTELGRKGERYTIRFEKKRVGCEPAWTSIDSNLAGYDIKSMVSSTNPSPLLIEVKATNMDIRDAFFHITSNEWHTAQTAKMYRFYLWSFFLGKARLASVDPSRMRQYIPTNNASGEWESTKIPFASFEDLFVEA